jgi:hypothetical protein
MMLDAVDKNIRKEEIISPEIIDYLEGLGRSAREFIDEFIILEMQENNQQTNATIDEWTFCGDSGDSDSDSDSDDEGFISEPRVELPLGLGGHELSSDI